MDSMVIRLLWNVEAWLAVDTARLRLVKFGDCINVFLTKPVPGNFFRFDVILYYE